MLMTLWTWTFEIHDGGGEGGGRTKGSADTRTSRNSRNEGACDSRLNLFYAS